MRKLIKRTFTQWLASDQRVKYQLFKHKVKLRVLNRRPHADVYLALQDPYSYLLAQVLPELESRYDIKFNVFFIAGTNHDISANQKLWRHWSLNDANILAKRYGLVGCSKRPNAQHLTTGQQTWQLVPKTVNNALSVFHQTWSQGYSEFYELSTPVINMLVNNQERQRIKGHYLPATIQFMGGWFWGVDRLNHFEQMLNNLHLSRVESTLIYDKTQLELNGHEQSLSRETITAYVSLRSPYSYLGLIQVEQLAKHYNLKLNIELVMPMVMRGLHVSQMKQVKIYLDAAREARSKNVPFSQFTDPIGDGVLNAYRFFSYAKYCGMELDYMKALYDAVYVKGIDLSKMQNVEKLFNSIALDFSAAQNFTKHDNWQTNVDDNASELMKEGLWGVPVFQFRDKRYWGQDRLWLVEQAIIDLNDN